MTQLKRIGVAQSDVNTSHAHRAAEITISGIKDHRCAAKVSSTCNSHRPRVCDIATRRDRECTGNRAVPKGDVVHIAQIHIAVADNAHARAKVVGYVLEIDARVCASAAQRCAPCYRDNACTGNFAARRDRQIAAQSHIAKGNIVCIRDRQIACDDCDRAFEIMLGRQDNVAVSGIDDRVTVNGPHIKIVNTPC